MNSDQFEQKKSAASLREKAERQLARAPLSPEPGRTAEETLYELQVHQIELEMQGEQLQQTQAFLEESRDRYVDLYEFAPIGYLTLSRDGLITSINYVGSTLLGEVHKKVLNRRFAGYVTPEDSDRWYLYFQKILKFSGIQNCELALRRVDGSVFYARLDSQERAHLETLEFRITITDISEIKRTENLLRDSNERISLLLTSTGEGVYAIDLDGRCTLANPACAKLLGYASPEDLIGHKMHPLMHYRHEDGSNFPFETCAVHNVINSGHSISLVEDHFFRADGSSFPVELSVYPMRKAEVIVGAVVNFNDITVRKQTEQRVERLLHFDALTTLPNRALFFDRAQFAINLMQRNNRQLSLMVLDLDRFKYINETLGHNIGDALLIQISARLSHTARDGDTVARLGSDEFTLLLPDTDISGATYFANKLLAAFRQPFQIESHEIVIAPSIGIAMYPNDGGGVDTLSKAADVAMSRVKHEGRNGFCFYAEEMQSRSTRTLLVSAELRQALKLGQLHLHYQPQVSLTSGHLVGVEALLRWQHPTLGAITPSEFIPIAEESGQILQIGEWVLRSAVRQLKTWLDNGILPMVVAVNLSAIQFLHPNLPELVTSILDEAKLSPEYLELELTESVAMGDPLGAIAVMNNLYKSGVRMSIDDFGTGYSSLSYLKKFEVYKLKIDQSFVRNITDDPDDKAIVTAIIKMASSLGMKTIAEGVETSEQLAHLRLQGCNEVQGYYISRPLSVEHLEEYMKTLKTVDGV